ncbi:hypothetical protein LDENG_00259920 [Lucifuga dentata]|nr:hypothetical protein LDENG_00259920 [Lucifuga dentata]
MREGGYERTGGDAATNSQEEGRPDTATRHHSRKRRARDAERIEVYKRLQEEFNHAEDRRQEREDASLEKWMKMQQEAEERHFRMLQEQQAATNTMFMNFMQMFIQGMSQQSQAPHPAAS